MDTLTIWRFRSQRTLFGLNEEYIKSVYEQFFQLKYYGSWSFVESYNLPVTIRMWFYNRLTEQLKKEQEALKNANKK